MRAHSRSFPEMKDYSTCSGDRENREHSAAVIRDEKHRKLAGNTVCIKKYFCYFYFSNVH